MTQPEVWLRGPVEGVPAALQPAAHALLQVKEEIADILADFPDDKLWDRPAGVASVGFHLKHIPGVVDRLFTYARGEKLSSDQMRYLSSEAEETGESKDELIRAAQDRIDKAIDELRSIDPVTLPDFRGVGRSNFLQPSWECSSTPPSIRSGTSDRRSSLPGCSWTHNGREACPARPPSVAVHIQ